MTPRSVDGGRLARLRAASQLLHRPRGGPTHPADVARAIGGAQAQEPASGRLSLRSRNLSLTAAEVERARVEERSLTRTWAMRNTAHLVATEDLEWMNPLFNPMMEAFNRRRLAHYDVDANAQERALSVIERSLERDGALTRTELSERLGDVGIGVRPEHRVHLFPLAVATGLAALGPGDGNSIKLVLASDWLPALKSAPREKALAEAARRHLAAFAPATEADLAGWTGLPLTDIRSGLASIASELSEVKVGKTTMLAPRGRRLAAPRAPLVRLLPNFDTYLMGHRDRDFIAPPDRWKRIAPGGGILRATISLDGRAIGTWKLRRTAGKLAAELEPFETLDPPTRALVERELEDVARFEGQPIT